MCFESKPTISTPDGIIETSRPRTVGLIANLVLNACRHHRNIHSRWPVGRLPSIHRCSTPDGIIGTFTRADSSGRDHQALVLTPDGIIETFTRLRPFQ